MFLSRLYALQDIEDSVLPGQFRGLCDSLNQAKIKQLEGSDQSRNSNMLRLLINTKLELYKSCELMIHGFTVSALKCGAEWPQRYSR